MGRNGNHRHPRILHLSDADVEALGAELTRCAVRSSPTSAPAMWRTCGAPSGAARAGDRRPRRASWVAIAAGCGGWAPDRWHCPRSSRTWNWGHNVMHGQWDWMNDPEVHSATWEWDMVCAAPHWKHSHNYVHHKYTNVVGMDHDVGYKTLRVTRDEPWRAAGWRSRSSTSCSRRGSNGVALQRLGGRRGHSGATSPRMWPSRSSRSSPGKAGRQIGKDYVLFPALSGPTFKHTDRQPEREPHPEFVGVRGDLLRTFPRWR